MKKFFYVFIFITFWFISIPYFLIKKIQKIRKNKQEIEIEKNKQEIIKEIIKRYKIFPNKEKFTQMEILNQIILNMQREIAVSKILQKIKADELLKMWVISNLN